MTDFDHISIHEFLVQLRREPNPDDVLDWIDARAEQGLDDLDDRGDALLDIRGMIEAYRDARIALA